MLDRRTNDERRILERFSGEPPGGVMPTDGLAASQRASTSVLVLVYQGKRDATVVLDALTQLGVGCLPLDWHRAGSFVAHCDRDGVRSFPRYFSDMLRERQTAAANVVAVPVHADEFFAVMRLGAFEVPAGELVFAILGRRRANEDAAASYLEEFGVEELSLSTLGGDAADWMMLRAFELPQTRSIISAYLSLTRAHQVELMLDQLRAKPGRFFEKMLAPFGMEPGSRGQVARDFMLQGGNEDKLAAWVREMAQYRLSRWHEDGWEGVD